MFICLSDEKAAKIPFLGVMAVTQFLWGQSNKLCLMPSPPSLCYLLCSCSDQTYTENTRCTTSPITGRQIENTPLISRLLHSSLPWDTGVQFPLLPGQIWIRIAGDPGECSLCSPFGTVSEVQHQENQPNLQEGWGHSVGLCTT